MGKVKKRVRKFLATGGVKGRLAKGTITKKGKVRRHKRKDDDKKPVQKNATTENDEPKPDRSDDLAGSKNLGGLDLDSFFEKVAGRLEEGSDDDNDEKADDVADEQDDDDDDEMEDDEESADGDNETPDLGRKNGNIKPVDAKIRGSDDDGDDTDDEDSEGDTDGVQGEEKKTSKKNSKEDEKESDDDEMDSDDDDDVDAAAARMKKKMAALTESDPEFHKFLQENEQSLLDFDVDDDEDDEDEEDEDDSDDNMDDDDSPSKSKTEKVSSNTDKTVTLKFLEKLKHTAFELNGMKGLKRLVQVYYSACHMADTESNDQNVYVIESSNVFDELMVTCLHRCHVAFRHHLLPNQPETDAEDSGEKDLSGSKQIEVKPINPKHLEKSERWPKLRSTLLTFLRSTTYMLSAAKEPELQAFILKALAQYLPFLTPFPRAADAMLKTLVNLWSAPLDTSEGYQVVRLNAFFRIRQLAKTQPFPFIEACLKKSYLAYARRAKFAATEAAASLPTLTFMGNCVVELYSMDYHSSYQHAFVYIRQLALLLRAAIQHKTPEAFKEVYCWQFVNSLKLWTAVLSDAAAQTDGALMRSLIYPLTEIIMGTARLAPSAQRHFPLQLQCVRYLQQLAAASEMFIPTTSLLLDALNWREWHTRPKKTSDRRATRGMNLTTVLKFPKDETLRTHEQLEASMSDLVLLLEREVELYRYTAAFPEFSLRIRQQLRSFGRTTKNSRWRSFCRGCVELAEKYAQAAVLARSKLSDAPKDVKLLECLRPPSAPSMRERHAQSLNKEAKRATTGAGPSAPPSRGAKKRDDLSADGKPAKKRTAAVTVVPAKKQKIGKKNGSEEDNLLDEEDDLQEGVDWSDSED